MTHELSGIFSSEFVLTSWPYLVDTDGLLKQILGEHRAVGTAGVACPALPDSPLTGARLGGSQARQKERQGMVIL